MMELTQSNDDERTEKKFGRSVGTFVGNFIPTKELIKSQTATKNLPSDILISDAVSQDITYNIKNHAKHVDDVDSEGDDPSSKYAHVYDHLNE